VPESRPRPCAALASLFVASGIVLAAPKSPVEPGASQGEAQAPAEPTRQPTGAQSPVSPAGKPQPAPGQTAQRDEDFKKLVTNVRLEGHFTLDGQEPGELQREEYVITGAMKFGNGDFWALTSRIRYGDVDLTVPVPVRVKWAGNTPVITVDSVKIPGLGTFSARVLLDGARYAGTWSHDEKGGHLFGEILPADEKRKQDGR
jgi:hypothetical protein